jgi:hypothetical protein
MQDALAVLHTAQALQETGSPMEGKAAAVMQALQEMEAFKASLNVDSQMDSRVRYGANYSFTFPEVQDGAVSMKLASAITDTPVDVSHNAVSLAPSSSDPPSDKQQIAIALPVLELELLGGTGTMKLYCSVNCVTTKGQRLGASARRRLSFGDPEPEHETKTAEG